MFLVKKNKITFHFGLPRNGEAVFSPKTGSPKWKVKNGIFKLLLLIIKKNERKRERKS
jgi:hypothetical protein